MAKLRVHNFSVSIDGFGAGSDQSLGDPLGAGGEAMHTWVFETRSGRQMMGPGPGRRHRGRRRRRHPAGRGGHRGTIMGRNMFGPVRGPWPDESWSGWWGEAPPYHHPVYVAVDHDEGGTVFHFVADG